MSSASTFFLRTPTPPRSTLFPYTTLFRSDEPDAAVEPHQQPLAAAVQHLDSPPGDRPLDVRRRHGLGPLGVEDRKSTRLNSSHSQISYAVFCLKKKKGDRQAHRDHDAPDH